MIFQKNFLSLSTKGFLNNFKTITRLQKNRHTVHIIFPPEPFESKLLICCPITNNSYKTKTFPTIQIRKLILIYYYHTVLRHNSSVANCSNVFNNKIQLRITHCITHYSKLHTVVMSP